MVNTDPVRGLCHGTPAIRSFPSLRQYISDQSQCVKNEENRKVIATFVSFCDRAKENRSTMLSIECRCPAALVTGLSGNTLRLAKSLQICPFPKHDNEDKKGETDTDNKMEGEEEEEEDKMARGGGMEVAEEEAVESDPAYD
jgi:hypothetical protein